MARAWREAAARADVAAEVDAIYADVAAQIEARGPACWASGRCCNFERAGHLLYVTGLEAAFTVLRREPTLVPAEVSAARARGGCPFQEGHLCGAHAIRPLGCRVYFCDRSAQEWQHALSEHALEQIRSLHDRFAIPYRYGEWRAMLELLSRHAVS